MFAQTLALFERNQRPVAMLFLDIDNFKQINDTYGHLEGDKVLVRIAQLLESSIRKSDLICRWGGEEFAVLLRDTNGTDAQLIAEKLRRSIENEREFLDIIGQNVSASFGVTEFRINDSINSLITRVDQALYEAKHSGKNRWIFK